jgi:hypothetical protein
MLSNNECALVNLHCISTPVPAQRDKYNSHPTPCRVGGAGRGASRLASSAG